jgi:hypothetical protein
VSGKRTGSTTDELTPPVHAATLTVLRSTMSRPKVSCGAKRGGVSLVWKMSSTMRVGSRGRDPSTGRPPIASRQRSK